jgi:hypothetical protein
VNERGRGGGSRGDQVCLNYDVDITQEVLENSVDIGIGGDARKERYVG